MPVPELWIVVCEDLHGSAGPFQTVDLAIEAAKDLTKQGNCKYKPVRFRFIGEVIEGAPPTEENDRGYGQYL